MKHAWRINKRNGYLESFTTLERTAERMKELQAEGDVRADVERRRAGAFVVEHYTTQTHTNGRKWWYAVDPARVVASLG